MPTYITLDLVPPVLALHTSSHRGTWALAGPPRGHAHPPQPAPRAHFSANVATHTHHTRLASAPLRGGLTVQSDCCSTAVLFSHPSKRRPRSVGSRLPGDFRPGLTPKVTSRWRFGPLLEPNPPPLIQR